MNRFTGAVCAALALLAAAPSSSRPSAADPGTRRLVAQAAAASGKDTVDVFGIARTGINLTARDPSVRPGNDFFLHANGAWNRFVRDRLVSTGGSASLHSLINEEAENQVREIIERP